MPADRRPSEPRRRPRFRPRGNQAISRRGPLAAPFLLGFLAGGLAGAPAAAGRQRPPSPPQLVEPDQRLALDTALGLPRTLDFDVSRDGRRVVLAVASGRGSTLFLAAAGARPGVLTSGRRWDSAPRFLPDGLAVVFVSGPRPAGLDPEAGRLFHLPLGGEPEPLTDRGLLVRSPAAGPDGERIAFLGRRPEPELPEGEADTGYDLWLVSAEGGPPPGEARRLTRHPGDEGPPVWSPDGRLLAYSYAGNGGRGLAVVAAAAGDDPSALPEPRLLTSGSDGSVRGAPSWTPDGGGLAWTAASDCAPDCSSGGFDAIRFADAAGASPSWPLFAGERDRAAPRFRPTVGPADGLELAWIEAHRGNRRIHRSRLRRGEDGKWNPAGRIRVLTRGAGVASGLRWKNDGSALVALYEAPAFPRDVWSFPLEGGRERISDTLFPELDVRSFVRPERIEAESTDGLTIGAFLYRPLPTPAGEPGAPAEPGADAPLLVHLRGMAGTPWRNGFDPIVQLLAGRGYAVLAPNVRGTSGRGAAFAARNDGDWGGGDLEDLVAATRAAQTRPGVSPDEACVFGIGYGGFLALAALARHPDLFACGIEAMGTADLLRLHRALDPERRARLEAELGPRRGNLANYRRLSLTGEGGAVRAPLLSFHGEQAPEAPLEAKQDFLAELRARPDYPLVELYFRGDTGRSVFRWVTDRGANYAFLQKTLEFLSLHLPLG